MKTYRDPEELHKPVAAYSHQIEVSPSERWLVLSGQVGMTKDGSIPEDTIGQMKVALDNIHINLQAANMTIKDITKLTIYLVGEIDAKQRQKVLEDFLGDLRPCMTLLFVAALAHPVIKVEIDAMASCEG